MRRTADGFDVARPDVKITGPRWQKYLDPSMRPNQTQGNPVLIEGSVTGTQPGAWVSADHFTVQAELELRFSKDPGAWGNGTNTRFVTFVRSSASAPYEIRFATGP